MPKYLLTNEVISTELWKMLAANPAYSENLATKAKVAKSAACTYFKFRPGVTVTASGDFPDIALAKSGWRTEGALNGAFASGNWTFRVRLENDTKYGFSVKVACRLSRSANSDGSSATLIGTYESPNVIAIPASAGGSVTDSWTANPGAVALSNEYLFAEYRIHVEVAATGTTAQCSFADDEDPATADESIQTTALSCTYQLIQNLSKIRDSFSSVLTKYVLAYKFIQELLIRDALSKRASYARRLVATAIVRHLFPLAAVVQYAVDILIYRWYGTNTAWGEAVGGRSCVLVDSSKFVNPKFYFEAVLRIENASATASARLLDIGTSDVVSGGTEVAGSVLSTQSTDFVRVRSGALSLTSGNRFRIQSKTNNASYNAYTDAARIIVEDDISTGWTKGEEAVDVFMPTTYTPSVGDTWITPTSTPIHKYEASPRDGSVALYFEACLSCDAASQTVRARLIEHSNPDLSDTGTAVANSEVSVTPATADVPVRARSAGISLQDGMYYAVQITCATANKQVQLQGAKVIVQQSGTLTKTQLRKRVGRYLYTSGTAWLRTESQAYLEKPKLPRNRSYSYECTMRISDSAAVAYCDLYNLGDSASVSGSQLQTNSTLRRWLRSSGLALIDLKDYDARLRSGTSGYTNYMAAAYLVMDVSTVFAFPYNLLEDLSMLRDAFNWHPKIWIGTFKENLSALRDALSRRKATRRSFPEDLSVSRDIFSSSYGGFYKFTLVQDLFVLRDGLARRASYVRKLVNPSSGLLVQELLRRGSSYSRRLAQDLSAIRDAFISILTPIYVPVYKFVENLSSLSVLPRRLAGYSRRQVHEAFVQHFLRRSVGFPRRVAEDLSALSDALARRAALLRRVTSVTEIRDAFSFVLTPLLPVYRFVQSLVIRDALTRRASYARRAANTTLIMDILSRVRAIPRTLPQDLSVISEVFSRRAYHIRRVTERLHVSDSLRRILGFPRKAVDDLSAISTAFSRRSSILRRQVQTVVVQELLRRAQGLVRSERQDLSAVRDLFTRRAQYLRRAFQSTYVQDALSYMLVPFIQVYRLIQSIVISMELRRRVVMARSLREDLSSIRHIFSYLRVPYAVHYIYLFVQDLSSIGARLRRAVTIDDIIAELGLLSSSVASALDQLEEKIKRLRASFNLGKRR